MKKINKDWSRLELLTRKQLDSNYVNKIVFGSWNNSSLFCYSEFSSWHKKSMTAVISQHWSTRSNIHQKQLYIHTLSYIRWLTWSASFSHVLTVDSFWRLNKVTQSHSFVHISFVDLNFCFISCHISISIWICEKYNRW